MINVFGLGLELTQKPYCLLNSTAHTENPLHSSNAYLILPFCERLCSSLPFSCSQLTVSQPDLRMQPCSRSYFNPAPCHATPFGNPPWNHHHRTLHLITKPLSESYQLPCFSWAFCCKSRFRQFTSPPLTYLPEVCFVHL